MIHSTNVSIMCCKEQVFTNTWRSSKLRVGTCWHKNQRANITAEDLIISAQEYNLLGLQSIFSINKHFLNTSCVPHNPTRLCISCTFTSWCDPQKGFSDYTRGCWLWCNNTLKTPSFVKIWSPKNCEWTLHWYVKKLDLNMVRKSFYRC